MTRLGIEDFLYTRMSERQEKTGVVRARLRACSALIY